MRQVTYTARQQHPLEGDEGARKATACLDAPWLLVELQQQHPWQARRTIRPPCLPHKRMGNHRVKTFHHVKEDGACV
eukprot:2121841-Pyramimonas_sp.AAC.1